MPSIYALKGRFQDLLRPLVRRLHASGATANQVTVAAALVSVGVGAFVGLFAGTQPLLFLLLPAWLGVRMALNAIDGMLAREFGQRSTLGAYLNELGEITRARLSSHHAQPGRRQTRGTGFGSQPTHRARAPVAPPEAAAATPPEGRSA